MTKVLIGLPIYKREWVLPHWLECIEKQDFPLSNLGFIFALGPDDPETHDLLWKWHTNHPEVSVFDGEIIMGRPHHAHLENVRSWSQTQYHNMVIFRNNLLDRATAMQDRFDYYFSLDSDLLLEDPHTINQLIEDCQIPEVDVVSPLSYMTPADQAYPSSMFWEGAPGGRASRDPSRFQKNTLYKVDIVMAAVFMSKPVFTQARYYHHRQGEDLGFATDLARLGFNSYTDTRIYLPHMMHRSILQSYLEKGYDPRKP